jgi:hypothetical protein
MFLTTSTPPANESGSFSDTLISRLDRPDLPIPEMQVDTLTPFGDRERIRLILIGAPVPVTQTIQTLDRLSFVEMHRWSQFVTAPDLLHLHPSPGEVLSVLTRHWLTRNL